MKRNEARCNFWPRLYLRNVRASSFFLSLSPGFHADVSQLEPGCTWKSLHGQFIFDGRRESRPRGRARGCVYARVHAKRTRRESAQASNFTGNTRLGTRRRRRRLQHRSKRVKGCCCIAPVVPLRPPCNALTQSQLSPFPLSRVHRALSPLALNVLLRASCQRRSKVPSPTTYCRDTFFFFFPFFSFFSCFLSLSFLSASAAVYTELFPLPRARQKTRSRGFLRTEAILSVSFDRRCSYLLLLGLLRDRLQNHLYHSPLWFLSVPPS